MAKKLKFNSLDEWLAHNPLYLWRGENSTDDMAFTMRDAGEAIGASYTSILYWERGDFTPKHKYMVILAAEMKITVGSLYDTWQTWLDARPAETKGAQLHPVTV